MVFRALAADYDGTLASQDRIALSTVAALEEARRAGLRLILVTGRTFFELTRVCERLDLFDAIVAENGAVLHYPREGAISDEAPEPSQRLLAELDRRAIPYQLGRVIVGTARGYEDEVRAAMATAGVHLDLVTNRAALMLLPSGISKATGVRRALQRLRVSFHDVLAIGDAENDLELFTACGFAACPGNAVDEVMRAADWVFSGDNGSAIARAITGPILDGTLPPARSARERIPLGRTRTTAEPVTIPAHGVNVLVQGDSLSGKSWLAGGMVEQLAARHYATLVIDPEGDYPALAAVSGVTSREVTCPEEWDEVLEDFEHDPGASIVVDLASLAPDTKLSMIENGLTAVRRLRRRHGRPHWVFLDEAHFALRPEGVSDEAAGLEDKGFCLITYRASWLRETALDGVDVLVFARTTAPSELEFLRSFMARRFEHSPAMADVVRELAPPEFLVVSTGAGMPAGAVTFQAPPRLTPHVRHLGKYSDQPVAPHEAFFFRSPDGRLAATADTLRAFLSRLRSVDDRVLAAHASRGDFSRWLADVFLNRQLGNQLRKIERRGTQGEGPPLRDALVRFISAAIDEV